MTDPTDQEPGAGPAPPPGRPRWRRWLRRLGAGLGVTVAGLLTLVLLILAALQIAPVRQAVVDLALGIVNDGIRGSLEVEAVDGDLVRHVGVRGVAIRGPDDRPILTVDEARVTWSLPALLSGEVRVERVAIRGVRGVILDPEGEVALARAFEPVEPAPEEDADDPGEPSELVVIVEEVLVEGRSVALSPEPGAVALTDLEIRGGVRIEGADVAWRDVRIAARTRNVPVSAAVIRTEGRLAAGGLHLDRLFVAAGPHRLAVSGEVLELDDPRLDVTLGGGRFDLDALGAALGVEGLRGRAELTGRVTGPLSDLRAHVELDSTGGRITVDAHADLEAEDLEWSVALRGLDLRPHRVLATFEPALDADLSVRASGAGDPLDGGRVGGEVRLERVSGIPEVPAPLVVRAEAVDGGASVEVEGRDGGSSLRLEARTPAVLDGPYVAEAEVRDLDVGAWADLLALPELAGVVEHLEVTASARLRSSGPPAVDADLTLRLSDVVVPPEWGVGARADALDLRADVAWPGEGLPIGTALLGGRGVRIGGLEGVEDASVDDLEIHAELEPEGEAVRGRGRVRLGGAAYGAEGRLKSLSVPFDLRLDDDGLPEQGGVEVHASGARWGDIRLAGLNLDAEVARSNGGFVVTGPLSLRRLRVGADLSLASARTDLDVRLDEDGTLHAGAGFRLRGLDVRGAHRLGSAEGDVRARLPGGDPERLVAVGSLELRDLRSGADLATERGSVVFDLAMTRDLPTGRVSVRLDDATLAGRPAETVRLDANLEPGGPSRVRLHASQGQRTGLAELRVDGPLDLSQPIRAELVNLRLVADGAGFRVEPGAWVRVDPATGSIAVGDLRLRDEAESDTVLSADLRYDAGTGAVEGDLEGEDIPLDAWVHTLRRFGVPILEQRELRGTLSVNGRIRGTLRKPTARLSLRLRDVLFEPFRDLDATLGVRIAEDATAAHIKASWAGDRRLELTASARAPLSLEGGLPLDLETPVELVATLEHVLLEDFADFVPETEGEPLAGRVDGTIRLKGTLADPRAGVSVTVTDFSLGPVRDARASVDVGLFDDATRVNVTYARGQQRILRIEGAMPINLVSAVTEATARETVRQRLEREAVRVMVKLAPSSLQDVPYTEVLGPLRGAVVSMDLQAGGTLGEPELTGRIEARDVPVAGTTAAVHASVDTRDQDLLVWADMTSGGVELVGVEALLPKVAGLLLTGDDPAEMIGREELFVAATSRVPVRAMNRFFPDLAEMLDGMVADALLSGSVVLRGGDEAERALDVRFGLTSARPGRPLRELGLASGVRGVVRVGAGETRASIVVDQGAEGGHLMVDGGLDLSLDALAAGEVGGDIPVEAAIRSRDVRLAGLSRLLPTVFGPSEGILDVRADISGTVGDPDFEGRVAAHFATLNLAITGYEQEDVTVALGFDRDRVRLVPIHLRSEDGGTMDVEFTMALGDLDPTRMEMEGAVRMDTFRLLDRRDMRVRLSGAIDIGGNLALPSVSGRLTIDDSTFRPDMGARSVQSIGMPEDVVFIDAAAVQDGEDGAAAASTGGVDLDLTIVLPARHLRVRNEMADILLEGELRVLIQGEDVVLDGIIQVVEGKVEVYGRELQLSPDSRIVFTGSRELNPTLDVTATYDISDVDLSPLGLAATDESRIAIRVSGTAEEPVLDLTSDPPMDETNILSIIAVGHPVGGSGQEQAVESQVTNMFVGLALGPATRFVTEKLPIDVFEVQTGGEGGLTEAQITAGTRLTKDLMVFYDANLGADPEEDNVHEVRVQYTISRSLKLETRYGDANEGGLELLLRRRY